MSKNTSRPASQIHLVATLLGHLLPDGLRIGPLSECHFAVVVLISLCSPESHVVKIFITSGASDRLESRGIVHIDVGVGVAPLGVIDNVRFANGRIVELVNVASVEVLSNVQHDRWGWFSSKNKNKLPILNAKISKTKNID